MAEYIEREAFRKSLLIGSAYLDEDTMMTVVNVLDCFPAADVTPVRHGRWTTTSGEVFPGSGQLLCYSHKHEECGFQYVDLDENEYDYCPNCGAIMDLK